MTLANWFSAVSIAAVVSSCGTEARHSSANVKMAPPGAITEKEAILKVVFESEPGYAPDAGLYWVFNGPVYHVEVSRDVSIGRLWEGSRKLGDLSCSGTSTKILCNDQATGGRLYKFSAIQAADHPRLFPYATLTIIGGGGWEPTKPIDESPFLIGKHLELRDDAMIMDVMTRASQIRQLEGSKVSCKVLLDETMILLVEKGIIYPAANASDRLFVALRTELVRTYGLCY
jgi:hypothetical protein